MYCDEVDCCNNGCGETARHDVVTGDWSQLCSGTEVEHMLMERRGCFMHRDDMDELVRLLRRII